MKKKKKARHRHQKRPDPGSAIVKAEVVSPTVIRGGRERELTQTEIDLVHRTVAKGTDEDQFALFLWFCRKHGLDPVAKEVYCLLFKVAKHHQDEKGIWYEGKEMVILTGIGGLRGLAGRNYPLEYGSTDEPEFTFSGQKTPAGKLIPDTCTVRVWKKGAARPTSATLYWEEFAPHDLTEDRFKFWNKSPKNQLAKCTEGQALKKAYPDLSSIYVTEELARRISEETPEGRDIRYPQDRLQAGSHEAAQKVLEEKLSGQRPLHQPATIDVSSRSESRESTSPERQHPAQGGGGAASTGPASPSSRRDDVPAVASDRSRGESPPKAPKGKIPESEYRKDNIPPAKQAEPWKYNGSIELDYSDDQTMPYVRGGVAELAGDLSNDLTLRRRNDFWCCFAEDVPRIKLVANAQNFRVNEVLPSPPAKSKEAKTKPTSAKSGQESAGSRLAKGIIERVISGMTGNNNPLRNVTMLLPDKRRPSFSCFDKALFEWLDKGNGKPAELYVQTRGKYTNIVGLKLCAGQEFDSDGKTPVIQP